MNYYFIFVQLSNCPTDSMSQPILILGIGNILLGDEGVGVHVVRELEKLSLPEHVSVLDGGTGGFHLLAIFEQNKRMILIDATLDGNQPGTVNLLKPKYSKDFPKTLSAHDIGLKDLVESSALLGFMPEITLITVSIKEIQPLAMELSDEVRKSIPEVIALINKIINDLFEIGN
jgi:hydrogenase maturation protease